jgi:hypothetical protein
MHHRHSSREQQEYKRWIADGREAKEERRELLERDAGAG